MIIILRQYERGPCNAVWRSFGVSSLNINRVFSDAPFLDIFGIFYMGNNRAFLFSWAWHGNPDIHIAMACWNTDLPAEYPVHTASALGMGYLQKWLFSGQLRRGFSGVYQAF